MWNMVESWFHIVLRSMSTSSHKYDRRRLALLLAVWLAVVALVAGGHWHRQPNLDNQGWAGATPRWATEHGATQTHGACALCQLQRQSVIQPTPVVVFVAKVVVPVPTLTSSTPSIRRATITQLGRAPPSRFI